MENLQKELEKIIEQNKKEGTKPSLLLHACCAPCSSYCIEYLHKYFDITLFFYNPNIFPAEEYAHRVNELKRLVTEMGLSIHVLEAENDTESFYALAKGRENIREGGARCFDCYRLRLKKTAQLAREKGFDYFTTTLSISPLKNSKKLREIGLELEGEYGVKNLPSDFKKKEGYKRSIELSKKYNLYRQNYCGCEYSVRVPEQTGNSKK
ncbi:MAG: epoxyqueuosine reductase QueH [Clostridia bacterium]|nr:epoxyqueuosine reductase QueH [Clostridia bacterium]